MSAVSKPPLWMSLVGVWASKSPLGMSPPPPWDVLGVWGPPWGVLSVWGPPWDVLDWGPPWDVLDVWEINRKQVRGGNDESLKWFSAYQLQRFGNKLLETTSF